MQGQLLLERRPRASSRRDGHRARREAEGDGRSLDRVPRRRHARRGRHVRVAQHRVALAAPGAVRRREQPLRAVDPGRARARRLDRGARRRVRDRVGRAGHDRRRGDPRGGATCDRAHPRDGRAVLPRAQHVPLQPALEVGRPARSCGDRGAAHARPAARRGGAAPGRRATAIEALCEERLAETVEAADAAPAATPGVAA